MTDTNQRQLGNTLWGQGQGTISVLGCRGDAGSGDPAYRGTSWASRCERTHTAIRFIRTPIRKIVLRNTPP